MNQAKNFSALAILFLVMTFLSGEAFATYTSVSNGSFETGDFTDWNNIGSFSVTLTDYNFHTSSTGHELTSYSGGLSYYDHKPSDGNFFVTKLMNTRYYGTAQNKPNYALCTKSKIIGVNDIIDVNLNFSCSMGEEALNYYHYHPNCVSNPYVMLLSTPAIPAYTGGNVYNIDANKVIKGSATTPTSDSHLWKNLTGTLSNDTSTKYLCLVWGVESPSLNLDTTEVFSYLQTFDNIRIQKYTTLANTITTSAQPAEVLAPFNIYVSVADGDGTNITDATVKLNFNSDGNTTLSYNAGLGKYVYSNTGKGQGTYSYTVYTSKTGGYTGDTDTGSFIVQVNPSSLVTTCISNCSVSTSPTQVLLTNNNYTDDVTWKSYNSNSFSVSANFSIKNQVKEKQYFVYTSTNGTTWVFSDTLTFGATTSTPIQKIWGSDTYDYSFTDTVSPGVTTYYKLVYRSPALFWETIRTSSDWLNQNPPTQYIDANDVVWDYFADSNYTNVQSYTTQPYQDLVSTDFTVGYELQFTAYAATAGNLSVGTRIGTTDSTTTVAITTTPTRYSIPIAPSARDAALIFKSTASTSNTFYLTDYAIIPRSYFVGQLNILNSDYTSLQAILRNGASTQYILEGAPVRVQTSVYDSPGDLSKYEVQTFIGGTVVKDQFFDLTPAAGQSTNVNQVIDGVIDLNGIGGELTTTDALRTITYKVVLWNTSNQKVSEQFKTVSILQYPYFPNDLRMQVDVLNTKVGTNPRIQLTIRQAVSENFLGVQIEIYDSAHSLTSPNYYRRILATELKCASLLSCTNQLTFDDWVWDTTNGNTFIVQVTALLKTENLNYTDAYANVTKHVVTTSANYTLGQFLQYYERRYAITGSPYNSTEKIPLVLGLSDDTSKDLTNTVSPYFTLGVDTNSDYIIDTNYTTQYYPDATAYDETTGNTYWLWNTYLYKDNGDLFDNGDNVFFHVTAADKRNTQGTGGQIGFSPRCVKYPGSLDYPDANFLKGSIDVFGFMKFQYDAQWLFTLGGSVLGTFGLNGCSIYPPSVNGWDGNSIQIDDTYVPSSKQAQALYCGQKYGDTNQSIDKVGDDFECILFLKEDEEVIDQVTIQIGNENSDYSVTNNNRQYIQVSIPQTDIIFTDLSQLIRNWNTTGSPQDELTAQDILSRFAHNTLPFMYGTQLTADEIAKQYKWSSAIGGDTNFSLYSDFNNSQFNKVIAFKVSGLSVINAQDYVTASEASQMNLKQFLSYAGTNNLGVSPKRATVTIYNNSSNPYKVIETTAPLVINKAPSKPQQVILPDGNIGVATLSETLPFHVISTMSSANQTKNSRLIASLNFQQIIKAKPQTQGVTNLLVTIPQFINNLLFGQTESGVAIGLFTSPMGFMMFNWFWILMIVGFAIVGALIVKSIRRRG